MGSVAVENFAPRSGLDSGRSDCSLDCFVREVRG